MAARGGAGAGRLTPALSRPVERGAEAGRATTFSDLPDEARARCLEACRNVTEALYPGLEPRGAPTGCASTAPTQAH